MRLIRFNNANQYYQTVENYLLQDEAINCLPLASGLSLCDKDDCHGSAYLALVEDEGAILATANIPPRKLFLSKSNNLKAVELIVKDLAVNYPSVSGIIAPQTEAETFVAAWQKLTGQSIELEVAMQIQQLEKLNAIDSAAGQLRLATLAEIELLTEWIQAYVKEALGASEPQADSQKWVIRHLEEDSLYIWKNKNRLVSMAAFGGTTPNGIRVKSVYTPREHRGNGYATSCVAAMSQILLTRHKYCFLFTDTTNAISNKIYRKIGYVPMGAISDYKFY